MFVNSSHFIVNDFAKYLYILIRLSVLSIFPLLWLFSSIQVALRPSSCSYIVLFLLPSHSSLYPVIICFFCSLVTPIVHFHFISFTLALFINHSLQWLILLCSYSYVTASVFTCLFTTCPQSSLYPFLVHCVFAFFSSFTHSPLTHSSFRSLTILSSLLCFAVSIFPHVALFSLRERSLLCFRSCVPSVFSAVVYFSSYVLIFSSTPACFLVLMLFCVYFFLHLFISLCVFRPFYYRFSFPCLFILFFLHSSFALFILRFFRLFTPPFRCDRSFHVPLTHFLRLLFSSSNSVRSFFSPSDPFLFLLPLFACLFRHLIHWHLIFLFVRSFFNLRQSISPALFAYTSPCLSVLPTLASSSFASLFISFSICLYVFSSNVSFLSGCLCVNLLFLENLNKTEMLSWSIFIEFPFEFRSLVVSLRICLSGLKENIGKFEHTFFNKSCPIADVDPKGCLEYKLRAMWILLKVISVYNSS